MSRVLLPLLLIAAAVVIIWLILHYRSKAQSSNPYRGLSRRRKRELQDLEAQRRIDQLRQEQRQDTLKYLKDPFNDRNSDTWKEL